MNKMPVNEGQERVAAFPFDMQLFADGDFGGADNNAGDGSSANIGADVSAGIGNDIGGNDDEGNASNIFIGNDDPDVVGQGDDDDSDGVPEPVKKQSPEADRAFAELRRKAEAAERKAEQERRERDTWVESNFGQSHGLKTWEQYQAAIDHERRQKAEQEKHQQAQLPAQVYQKAVSDGYDPQIAQLMADKVKQDLKVQELEQRLQVSEQRESEKQRQSAMENIGKQIKADHEALVKKYGSDMVPALDSLDEGTLAMMRSGVPLKAAWLATHEDEVLEFAKRNGANKTLKNVNSKSHLQSEKSGGGGFEATVDLSPEQLRVWKMMGYSEKEAKKRAAKYKKQGKR